MKELLIKEKAEAYDRAIEGIQEILSSGQDSIKMSRLKLRLKSIFPELKESKESEDERVRKELITHCRNIRCVTEEGAERIVKWIVWLEKQDNEKPAVLIPKFKIGDWIVQENIGVYKVIEICESWYEVIDVEDKHYSISFNKEYMCHLWTIQDARKGDMLAAHECLVLFREIDGLNIRCYCTYHFINNPSFYVNTLQNKDAFHPATKEQRVQLEKAMVAAGFTLEKELKKIPGTVTITNSDGQSMDMLYTDVNFNLVEQNLAWSEEDENRFSNLISLVKCSGENEATKKGFIDFINRLKCRWKLSDKQIEALKYIEQETNYEAFTDEVLGKRYVCKYLLSFLDNLK